MFYFNMNVIFEFSTPNNIKITQKKTKSSNFFLHTCVILVFSGIRGFLIKWTTKISQPTEHKTNFILEKNTFLW